MILQQEVVDVLDRVLTNPDDEKARQELTEFVQECESDGCPRTGMFAELLPLAQDALGIKKAS